MYPDKKLNIGEFYEEMEVITEQFNSIFNGNWDKDFNELKKDVIIFIVRQLD